MKETYHYQPKHRILSNDHKRYISESMKLRYQKTGGMPTYQKEQISKGMKASWKAYYEYIEGR